MITENEIINAISVCVAYDPMHSPKVSTAIVAAWNEHFAQYPAISYQLLRAAIAEYYRAPDRQWPQPANLSSIARNRLRDQADRAPLAELVNDVPASAEVREAAMEKIRSIITRVGVGP